LILLDCDDDWAQPLAAVKYRKVSGTESLKQFINDVATPHGEQEFLCVRRKHSISNQVIQKYKNPQFDIRCPLMVQFRSSGTIELGIDAGGPTTEYFYHLMKEFERGSLAGIKLFEGEPGHWVPRFDYDLISGNLFKLVGRMILHSILNSCRGIRGISPAVINYVISGSRDTILEAIVVEDIPDPCLRERVRKVQYSQLCLCNYMSESHEWLLLHTSCNSGGCSKIHEN
jgi:hypothetical protein